MTEALSSVSMRAVHHTRSEGMFSRSMTHATSTVAPIAKPRSPSGRPSTRARLLSDSGASSTSSTSVFTDSAEPVGESEGTVSLGSDAVAVLVSDDSALPVAKSLGVCISRVAGRPAAYLAL